MRELVATAISYEVAGHSAHAPMIHASVAGVEAIDHSVVPELSGDRYESGGRGVSGADVAGHEILGQILRVADAGFEIPILFVRQQMPNPPGMIGMDLLAGSVLAIAPTPSDTIHWLVAVD